MISDYSSSDADCDILFLYLVTCESLNNCSSHGNCTGPNKCTCEKGFNGAVDCSEGILILR